MHLANCRSPTSPTDSSDEALIRAGQLRFSTGMNGAEDMIVDHDMIVTQAFRRLGKRLDRPCIAAEFDLRINHTSFHRPLPLYDLRSRPECKLSTPGPEAASIPPYRDCAPRSTHAGRGRSAVSSDKVLPRARAHQRLDPRAEPLHSGDEIVERQHHALYTRH
jgi:hypothetical protein